MPFHFRRPVYGAILWLLAISTSSTLAHVDLFIGKDEMRRLMGVLGELWYVEDGVVDRAAVEYEMEILPDVDDLYFSWANRGLSPIRYSITVKSDPSPSSTSPAQSAMSIPSTGDIEPVSPSSTADGTSSETKGDVFSIRLPPCEPQTLVDFRIRIRFEFDWPSSLNRTEVEIRRKKRCSAVNEAKTDQLQDADELESSGDFSDEKLKQKRSDISSAAQFLGSATNLFYVGMGCLFGLMIVTASLIILYFSKTDDGSSCCAPHEKTMKARDADDVASSLLPAMPRSQMISSTPLNRHSAALAFERGYRESGGSISSSSAAANGKQSHRSASPSALSKCTSGAGAPSFISAVNGNGVVQVQPHQQPVAFDTLPRVLHFNENTRLDLDGVIKRLLVDKSDVELGHVFLEGTFGEVCVGRVKTNMRRGQCGGKEEEVDEDDCGEWQDIIVKSLKEKASAHQVDRFLHESLRFVDLPPQPNVALPVAVSKTSGENGDDDIEQHETPIRYAVCFAHDGFGNLKKFLLRCRGADPAAGALGPPPMVLSTQDLVYAALQIIRGLLHLHKFRLLHRDVAVRNCLVGHDLTIQICDTGLSRDLFPQDYHCLGDNENRPIKWLSFESLERSEFSTASDVWAFGVTLWELTTLAQQPYPDVDPFEMQTFLSADQRLSQPYNCPDELYLLMYCCWNLHAEARPTFSQLLAALEHFYAQLTQYI